MVLTPNMPPRACLAVVALALCALTLPVLCLDKGGSRNLKNVLFVPLDERYATRGLFLNLVPLAGQEYAVATPPTSLISNRKTPANIPLLQQWVEARVPTAHAAIISFEQMVYGGLIASRTGNESLALIQRRVAWLVGLKKQHPGLKLYLATTVMRIPSYNGDFEEPWYWALYGRDLFEFSFYQSRFRALGNRSDELQAQKFAAMVPAAVVQTFLWRRARNFNVTAGLFRQQHANPALFEAMYLTLDDSGSFGFNVDEANALKALRSSLGLDGAKVLIYPGADEVASCLLSRMVAADRQHSPSVRVLWRVPNATGLIPNYEDQAVAITVREQLQACGARVVAAAPRAAAVAHRGERQTLHQPQADIVFAVNNFDGEQLEASEQPQSPMTDYAPFNPAVATCQKSPVLALADVRFSNGGDLSFVQWIANAAAAAAPTASHSQPTRSPCLVPGRFAYAGWNTDGNTLGTVAANAVLLATAFADPAGHTTASSMRASQSPAGPAAVVQQSKRFTLLRLLEDAYYQGIGVRQALVDYVATTQDEVENLAVDLAFYERFVFKPLMLRSRGLASLLAVNFTGPAPLASVFFPWNRTFEVGFVLSSLAPQPPAQVFQARAAMATKTPLSDSAAGTISMPGTTGTQTPGGGAARPSPPDQAGLEIECDVIIAGGSTAALAAAFAAADEANSTGLDLAVCLLEPTAWAGGQLTSSLVTALDFGGKNRNTSCLPNVLSSYLKAQGYPQKNPGGCWVSTYCYQAREMLDDFILPGIRKRRNLRVFFNTVVSETEVVGRQVITAVVGITRTPVSDAHLSLRYSEQVLDWYSAAPSPRFTKSRVRFTRSGALPPVVIDATEGGDVLHTSGATYTQGNEVHESSLETDDQCGQAIAFTLYMEGNVATRLHARHAAGSGTNASYNFSLGSDSWQQVWTYRRVSSNTSLIAWGSADGHGNDYPYGYHLLPVRDARAQRPWMGGLNLTTLARAEDYASKFSSWYASRQQRRRSGDGHATAGGVAQVFDEYRVGTRTGLAQVPYIRDTRRSVGVGGFRLNTTHLSHAVRFADAVALGDYIYFDSHNLHYCPGPQFDGELQPYYVPLRALTNEVVTNLLLAGKTMAQTNGANAATRLHPVEFSTGVASGVAAAYMINTRVPSTHALSVSCLDRGPYCPLQQRIATHAPIEWACAV